MGLFTLKSVKLQNKSNRILDTFTKTKEQLLSLNEMMETESAKIDIRIFDLNMQKTMLNSSKIRNEKVISNINKLFQ